MFSIDSSLISNTRLTTLPPPLHAPDGFFSAPVAIGAAVVSGLVIAYALRRTDRQLNEKLVPAMGVMAAFIFAAQMINFPIAGGTSGHLIGGALAAIVLGPWAAILVLTAVIALQALLFQDGGLIVMGVNLLTMAVFTTLAGYWVFRVTGRIEDSMPRLLGRGFIAAWVSVVLSASVAAVALSLSGTSPLAVALPAMAGVHALIGVGEGLITVAALSLIRAARGDLLALGTTPGYTGGYTGTKG